MDKKKLLALLMCLCMVFAFTACGGGSGEDTENDGPTMAEEAQKDAVIDEAKAPTDENKAFGALSHEVKADWDNKYQYGKLSIGSVGDTLVNDFFDWTINSVKTAKEAGGTSAGDGYKFVIINMSMKNTEDFAYETGNFEFRGIAGAGDANELDSMNAFYDGMIGDEFNINPGETVTGDLLYKVKEGQKSFIVDYEEVYGDGSMGNTFWFEFKLK